MSKEGRWRSTRCSAGSRSASASPSCCCRRSSSGWMHLDTLQDRRSTLAGRGELAEPQAAGMHPERRNQARGVRRAR